ncbi:glyoxalase [Vibrio cyclitrophicus]|uniref:glyoxalase n=1 Tax=Vibrio cyclitrophicus TaxID=47951 RepID=UPI000C85A80D|nr:glyoxalase [Vibrio cyclitrophicus]MBU2933147.1 glyoxalase [Vibrio cyclitrophicus]MBY7660187.1 glyoxalase [Vibrio atlanticus]PMK03797.1 glyoxalase [Vibrio cyclitrophicus]UPR24832.1 glyoxalase [Vibrio cyclitrophicus]
MENLKVSEIKSFVPAKDFNLSKRFCQSIGFEVMSELHDISYLRHGSCAFLLQNFYEPAHCHNYMMHLLVEDVKSWSQHIQNSNVVSEFEVTVSEVVEQPWGMLEFCIIDPSSVPFICL